MKLVFIGAGALGMLFAGKLARIVSQPPLMIAHTSEQATQLRSRGIEILEETEAELGEAIGTDSRSLLAKVDAIAFEEACSDPRWKQYLAQADWIFLMMKQQQLNDSLLTFLDKVMNPALPDAARARLICFQNGIGHTERLSRFIDAGRIYTAITTEGSHKMTTCQIAHKGKGQTIIGPVPSREYDADHRTGAVNDRQRSSHVISIPQSRHEQSELLLQPVKSMHVHRKTEIKLQSALNAAGFESYLSNQMERYIWNKLLINAIINPLTAIHRIKNGQLTESPFLLRKMTELYEEGVGLARAMEVNVAEDLWQQLLLVCQRTAGNSSSMLQDVLQGRQTEIEWINGSLIRMALQLGMSLPCHEALYDRVKLMELPG